MKIHKGFGNLITSENPSQYWKKAVEHLNLFLHNVLYFFVIQLLKRYKIDLLLQYVAWLAYTCINLQPVTGLV